MVNQENFDVSKRVQQTVADATDLSRGAGSAALKLQTDVWQNYQQLSPQDYGTYLRSVTANLKSNNAFDEVSVAWTRNNTSRFDSSGDKRLDQGELNAGIQRSRDPLEKAILVSVRDQYQDIKHAGGEGFLGIRKNSLDHDDFDSFAEQNQDRREKSRELNMRQGQSIHLMQPLLSTTDGTRTHSLFNTLDNVTGGAKDGNISRGDLRGFVEQYDRAALNGGDVNYGSFTRKNRDYAQRLADNWNEPEVERLRGKHKEQQGHYERDVNNSYITERSLLIASGYPGNTNLYKTFEIHEKPQPKPEAPKGPTPQEQLAEARSQFEQQVRQHINQEATYTVRPGQGFDRIARDVIRNHSDNGAHKNEVFVEQFSDRIAKMNNRSGRLDTTPVLHPGEQLRVFDDAWINAQIEARLNAFDTRVNKTVLPANGDSRSFDAKK